MIKAKQKADYLLSILGYKSSSIRVCDKMIAKEIDIEFYEQVKIILNDRS